jgi:hypothetical protein
VTDPPGRFRASRGPDWLDRRLAMLRTLEWANIGLLGVVLLWWLPAAQGIAVPVDTWQRTAAYLPVAGLLDRGVDALSGAVVAGVGEGGQVELGGRPVQRAEHDENPDPWSHPHLPAPIISDFRARGTGYRTGG